MRKVVSLVLVFIVFLVSKVLADSPQPRILLVRDAHYSYLGLTNPNEYYGSFYDVALQALGLSYDNCTIPEKTSNGPAYDQKGGCKEPISGMKDYDIVIWFTGDDYGGDYPTLTETDQNETAKYLSAGGKLFISGQNIGSDIGATDFYHNYLHAFFCTGNSNRNKTAGSIKDPIGDALNPNIDGGAGNQKSPSVVFTYTETYPNYLLASRSSPWIYGNSFYYTYYSYSYTCTDIGKTISSPGYTFIIPAAVRNHTAGPLGRKVVYFAFGLEGVYGDYNRTQIMKRVYDYFAGPKVIGTKIYRRNLENTSWEEGNLTCDPSYAYCLRKLSPLINATCIENQLFANVTGGEYFINSSEPARNQYQTGFQLLASDGSFNSPVERIYGTINLPSAEGTYTAWVHCNNTDNYYGKFDKAIFTVDRTQPYFQSVNPVIIEEGKRFTNKTRPKIVINTLLAPYTADYMAFSCDGTNWTEWIPFQATYSNFDITNESVGCFLADGNRTVYVKVRDEAGNLGYPEKVFSWIVLDTKAPQIINITPQNNSFLTSADNITITFSDPPASDGTSSGVNTSIFFNGTHYLQFSNNTPFNPGWSSEGLHTLTVYINDTAGNLNLTTYQFTVDNTPPVIKVESPQQGKIYSGVISILTSIADVLSGVNKAWYEIRNATNASQIFSSGSLSQPDWDATWNSSANITGTENVMLIVWANDTVGNLANVTVNFTVDNSKPTITIVKPRAIFLNKNFNIDIRAVVGNTSTANLTNATYYIFNSSSIVKTNSTTGINSSSFNFTDLIDISSWADGNYTINASAYDTLGNLATDSSWFYIDRVPPVAWNYRVDVEEDPVYKDRRIYPNTPITFYVNVSENVTFVDKVIVTLSTSTEEQNLTLSPLTQNLKNDTWKFSYIPSSLGYYNFTKIYANDTLGNVFSDWINISVLVVNGSAFVTLDNSNETDAGKNATLVLTFYFNKTFTNPNILIYIPPNSPANYNQTPNYFNVSPYVCNNCSLSYKYDRLLNITALNVTGLGNVTILNLSVVIRAGMPLIDTIDAWVFSSLGTSYTNYTKIKTPFLNITRIFCDNSVECLVLPAKPFNLTVELENVQTEAHAGKAYNVFAWFKDTLANNTAVGDIASGSITNVTWSGVVLNTTGNYTFTFGAWEQTKNYNATSKSFTIQVKDVDPPIISSPTWEEDNIINVNETTAYYVTVSDNVGISQVWATINQSTGYVENKTLTLSQHFISYDIWKLEYDNTSWIGNYTILRIYANDTSNNVGNFTPEGNASWFEVRELNINSSVAFESLNINATQIIYANITGNASAIESVLVNISKPGGFYESVYLSFKNVSGTTYIFEGSYTNITRSGDYNLTINVSLSSGISKSSITSFSVPYGNVSISFDWPILYLTNNTGKYNLTFYLIPDNGDLVGVNGSLIIDNTSVINLISEQNQSFGDILWEERARIAKWEVNVSNLGSTNITLWINSTTPSLEQNASKTINVTIRPEDKDPPVIYSFGHEWNVTNLMEPNIIWVSANDSTTVVDKVLVEVSYPGGEKENLTAVRTKKDFYELIFNNTTQTGNYSYRIFVIDIANNTNQTEPANFSVIDEFASVYVTHSPYNKGDEIIFQVTVFDVRGLPVKDFNLTLILERNVTGNYTVVNGTADSGRYRISITDAPPSDRDKAVRVTYTVYATVEKNKNKGTYKGTFEVSEELPTIIEYPLDNQYFQPGSPVPIEVSVRNERGEIVNTASVTAYCPRCSWQYKKIEWNPELEKYYDPVAFVAPQEETSFSIFVYSFDLWKNMGTFAVVATTKPSAAPVPQAPSAGGAPSPPCNCTEWKDIACGANGCKQDELYQTRVCMPAGCAEESRCIEHPACKERVDFEFTVSDSRISIEQGKDGIIVSTVKNIGTKNIIVVPTVEKDCCNLTLPEKFEIRPNEEVSFPIPIHVPLNTSTGEYSINIKMSSFNLTKERSIVVVVEKNRLVSLVEEYMKVLDALEKEIADYKKAGLDMSEAERILAKVKEGLAVASNSIQADDLKILSNSIREVESNINSINSKLLGLRIQKFLYENKWNILIGSILAIFSIYVSAEIIIPFYKLTKEIKELEFEKNSLINSRIETEKQFFLRKIDERTFRSIISEKQSQLYKITASLNLKKEERRKLAVTKLNPVYFYRWLKEGVKRLRKK